MQGPPDSHGALALRHLGTAVLAREPGGHSAHFGGISGLDRDCATQIWYLLSDDRSEHAPVRFYTGSIDLDETGFKSVTVTGTVSLKREDGTEFPGKRSGGTAPDPEALRVDPRSGNLFWTSEGDRAMNVQAFVREASRHGAFISELPLPQGLHAHSDLELGARGNVSLEGLAFSPDGSELWVAMEGPRYEDGPLPSLTAGAFARFTRLDRQGRVLAQLAYPVDPIHVPPTGGKLRADSGVSEILAIDDATLLVVERSGREVDDQVFRFSVRIYEARFEGATNVAGVASLAGARFVPMQKRLLLDLNRAGLGDVDNIEAAAWGPRLRNGNVTLLLASDDNFSHHQVTQFLAFEVIEPDAARGRRVISCAA